MSSCVQDVLGTSISAESPLMAAGIDSLGATELQRALNSIVNITLPVTLLFDHPSISEIVTIVAS